MTSLERFQASSAAIIYNPFAGRLSRGERSLQRTIEALQKQGISATLVPTTGPGTASLQARRQIEEGCDLIIAAGGDGTINEVANGMVHSHVPLAILPGGTANVLAREMKLPMNIEKAAAQIPSLRPSRISAGCIHGRNGDPRTFLMMAGAGLDAEIVYHLDLDLKAMTGKLAYYIGGFAQVFRPLSEFEVVVDGRSYQAGFALISRVRNYGGDLEIARGASLLREEFEIVLFRGTQSIHYLPYFVGVALRFVERMKGCQVLRGRVVTCQAPNQGEVYVQTDGELIGKLPFRVELIPDALTLMMPAAYLASEQLLQTVAICA